MARTSISVDQEILSEARILLGDREGLEEFVDSVLRQAVTRRRARTEFLARAIASSERARQSGRYVDSEVVLSELESILRAHEAPQR